MRTVPRIFHCQHSRETWRSAGSRVSGLLTGYSGSGGVIQELDEEGKGEEEIPGQYLKKGGSSASKAKGGSVRRQVAVQVKQGETVQQCRTGKEGSTSRAEVSCHVLHTQSQCSRGTEELGCGPSSQPRNHRCSQGANEPSDEPSIS